MNEYENRLIAYLDFKAAVEKTRQLEAEAKRERYARMASTRARVLH